MRMQERHGLLSLLVAVLQLSLLPLTVQPCGHHIVHRDIQAMVARHLAHQNAGPTSGAWGPVRLVRSAAGGDGAKGRSATWGLHAVADTAANSGGRTGEDGDTEGKGQSLDGERSEHTERKAVGDGSSSGAGSRFSHWTSDQDHMKSHNQEHGQSAEELVVVHSHGRYPADGLGQDDVSSWSATEGGWADRVHEDSAGTAAGASSEEKEKKLRRRRLLQAPAPAPRPIRLSVSYQLLDELDASQQQMLTRVVLAVRRILQKFILVKRPPTGGLLADPLCHNWYPFVGCTLYYPDFNNLSNDPDMRLCGLATIKKEHVVLPNSCAENARQRDVEARSQGSLGPASGAGNGSSAYGSRCTSYAGTLGEETDMYLYITAVQNEDCQSGAAAWARPCLLDLGDNRPLMGAANICPGALAALGEDTLTAVLAHEMIHALGFTDNMFNLTRRPDGSPRPYSEAIRRTTTGGTTVTRLITPNVRDAARQHFGCPDLLGAQLEEEGSAGSAGSHWEYTHFQGEVMVASTIFATDGSPPVLSNLTLSYLEDTGWYLANRSAMGLLAWGAGSGCTLPRSGCKAFQQADPNQNMFCDPSSSVSGDGSLAFRCSASYKATGVCRTANFTSGCGLLASNNAQQTCVSGPDDLVAMPDVFGWGSGSSSGRCFPTVYRFQASLGRNRYTYPANGRDGDVEAACFDTVCSPDGSKVFVKLFDQQFECREGAYLNLPQLLPNRYTAGYIGPCPPAAALCATQSCPAATCNAAGGDCLNGTCYCRLAFTGADCSFNLITGQAVPNANANGGASSGAPAPPPPPRTIWTQVVQLSISFRNERADFFTRSVKFKSVVAGWAGLDPSRVIVASIATPLGTSGSGSGGAGGTITTSGSSGLTAGEAYDGTDASGGRRRRRGLLQASPSPPPPPTTAKSVVTSLLTAGSSSGTIALVGRLRNSTALAALLTALAEAGFNALSDSISVQTLLTQVVDPGSPPSTSVVLTTEVNDSSSSSNGKTVIIIAIVAASVAVAGIIAAIVTVMILRSRRARMEQYGAGGSAGLNSKRAQRYAAQSNAAGIGLVGGTDNSTAVGGAVPLAPPTVPYSATPYGVVDGTPYSAAAGYPATGPAPGTWPVAPYGNSGGGTTTPEGAAYSYYSAQAAALAQSPPRPSQPPPQQQQQGGPFQPPPVPSPLYSGPEYGAYR